MADVVGLSGKPRRYNCNRGWMLRVFLVLTWLLAHNVHPSAAARPADEDDALTSDDVRHVRQTSSQALSESAGRAANDGSETALLVRPKGSIQYSRSHKEAHVIKEKDTKYQQHIKGRLIEAVDIFLQKRDEYHRFVDNLDHGHKKNQELVEKFRESQRAHHADRLKEAEAEIHKQDMSDEEDEGSEDEDGEDGEDDEVNSSHATESNATEGNATEEAEPSSLLQMSAKTLTQRQRQDEPTTGLANLEKQLTDLQEYTSGPMVEHADEVHETKGRYESMVNSLKTYFDVLIEQLIPTHSGAVKSRHEEELNEIREELRAKTDDKQDDDDDDQ